MINRQGWQGLAAGIRRLLSDDLTGRTSLLPLQVVGAHRQLLEEVARGRSRTLRFPQPLEDEFKGYCREEARLARATTALLTALLFVTAPAWTALMLQVPDATRQLTLHLSVFLLAPLFTGIAVAVLLKPRSQWVEVVFVAAFLTEVAVIEFLRVRAGSNDYAVIPVISVCVPLAILTLGRLAALRSLVFVCLYGLLLAVSARLAPWPDGPLAATGLLTVVIVLGIALVGTAFAQRTRRQTWCLIQLTQLGTLTDFLTGLPNRSALERHVEHWLRASRREGRVYTLAVVDLDFFKRVNDRYGHPYGDGVLTEAALTIASFARRPGDFAARVGGEEFVLFLYDCDAACAGQRLEQLRAAVEALEIENRDSPFGRVTASIGAVTVMLPEALAISTEKADQQLYEAKRSGRNRIVLG